MIRKNKISYERWRRLKNAMHYRCSIKTRCTVDVTVGYIVDIAVRRIIDVAMQHTGNAEGLRHLHIYRMSLRC